jgi:hypothetical protein
MRLRILALFAMLPLAAILVTAQSSMAGKWTSEGPAPIVLQLNVTTSGVTGTVTVGDSPTQSISDAKIDGNRLTFTTTAMLNGKEVPMSWDGELKNDALSLERAIGGRTLPPVVLKRSKQEAK